MRSSTRRFDTLIQGRWSPSEIHDYYESLFDIRVDDQDRLRMKPGDEPRKPTPYWQKVRVHAQLLMGCDSVQPGSHYALTDFVHCRSGSERGVSEALDTCVEHYLTSVLAISPATLVVVFGEHGKRVMRQRYPDPGRVTEPLLVEGRTRRLVYLAHPTATNSRRPKWLSPDELATAQRWLLETAPA